MGGVGGGYLCIDDFHDRKYLESVAKEIRRYVFRMGSFSLKLRNFSQRSTSVPSFRVLLAKKTCEMIHPLDDDRYPGTSRRSKYHGPTRDPFTALA